MPLLDVLAEEALVAGRPRVVDVEGRELLLVRMGDDVHAVDAECPHDGAPLLRGELSGLELRCERCGARFDLATGQCLRGGEDVRRYHARIEGGWVCVQLDPPLAEVEQARLVASLRTALIENDQPRLARECVRLLSAGAEPLDVVRLAVRYGAERGPGGFHSSLAACADFARVAPLYPGLEQAIPLTQALVAVGQANRGRGQRPIPAQARGVLVGSAEARREQFARLVEARDAEGAEAMLSGALYQGLAASEAQQWVLTAACAHVIDGGATLVHAVKALELCEALGQREANFVLPPLVPPLVYGIRADARGPLSEVSALFAARAEGLQRTLTRVDPQLARGFDDRAIRTTLLEGTPTGAFEAVLAALSAGVPPVRVGVAIALAAAERVLRFDERLEWDDTQEVAWADVVVPFHYAVAAMKAVERWAAPQTVRALVLAAARVQATRPLDLPPRRRVTRSLPVPPDQDEALALAGASVRARHGVEAVSLARGYVERGHDPWPLAEALARFAVEDGLPAQGEVELAAATMIAAVDAWEAAGDHSDAALPLFAAVRLLAGGGRQRFAQRHIAQAIARQGRS